MAEAHTASYFRRQIYQVFRRNSALAHFLTLRIRPAGVLLILAVPAAWILMPQNALGPLFQIRGIIFAVLGVSLIWAFFRRAKLTARRELPRLATAGEPMHYRVIVKNTGRRRLSGTRVLEMVPDNRPTLENFANSREPGEEKRNFFDRKLGYYRWEWLQRGLTLFSNDPSPALPSIAPGESSTTRLSLTPTKRGIISLTDLRVCLPDPLGVFQRCRKIKAEPGKLIVLPHRYRLPDYEIPGSARFQLGGEAASSTTGQSGDFTCVREYRPGDPLRHIHWKSWARTGKAIVKEYEDVFFPRYGLVLDTFAPAEEAEMFEQAVSVAASFAASIDTRESLLDLMFIRSEAYVFSAGRGEERIDKMLEVLAGVQCAPQQDFEALQKLILRYRDDLTACICIFTGWCEQRRDVVANLRRVGMQLKVISICQDLESAHRLHAEFPAPVPIQWLRTTHIEEDLHQRLA
ncbi:DUF58 domain-containing protein [Verrucomicrobiaceae bacterium R5-34]|uniref:DUF58 domain-containing protein n=1 Tax=Oceaniferula flava TaxID=2800421 RepID=A0AAE2SA47_9BACT|nr:DUF58 domain-containing protein [Oceaniferula flavus]MBK1831491.1 DUF58 domain-containing protein [Verrucomicrobiaceae bacterium R5-34]MBK1854270.1 DUF58 domain-containing protein [Oceaniferula flavus]MBM1135576.1 DUF58 domain-containing protein [Oceaniferula flavus]